MRDSGLLPVLARLVKGYSARHSPRSHACDLVSALHTTLRLLTRLNASGWSTSTQFSSVQTSCRMVCAQQTLDSRLHCSIGCFARLWSTCGTQWDLATMHSVFKGA